MIVDLICVSMEESVLTKSTTISVIVVQVGVALRTAHSVSYITFVFNFSFLIHGGHCNLIKGHLGQ